MNPDLDTLVTALYVRVDDLLVAHPEWAPEIAPRLSDAELVTLAVLQALLGFDSEARFIRYAAAHLQPWFPFVPQRPATTRPAPQRPDTSARWPGTATPTTTTSGRGLDPGGVRPQPRDPEGSAQDGPPTANSRWFAAPAPPSAVGAPWPALTGAKADPTRAWT